MDNNVVLINGKIFAEDRVISSGFIRFDQNLITEIGPMSDYHTDFQSMEIDLAGKNVIPGLIDVHIHGAGGADVMDGKFSALQTMVQVLPQEGTTSFLATTITQSDYEIIKALKNVANFINGGQMAGQAEILGVHLKGPFINPEMAGAQPAQFITQPQISLFEKWQEQAGGAIKLVTMAPEKDRDLELVRYITQKGVVASIGHSNAKYAEVLEAIDAGLSHVTHIFNQMKGLHHREPGVVGAALLHDELYVELIADGVHVCPEIVNLVYRNKKEKIILITDSMRAKCLKNGIYDLGGQEVTVKDGKALLENGRLAGSVLKLGDAVKNMMEFVNGCTLPSLIQMTSSNPAKELNLFERKGSLKVG